MPISKITFIGSGKVATALAKALYKKGYTIDQVYSRDPDHAERLATQVNAKAINDWESLDTHVSDVYIISVNDDAIPEIATKLHTTKYVVHTSGKTDLDALQKISKKIGVFYPFQTFSADREVNFLEVPFMLEASDESMLQELDALALNLTSQIYHFDSRQRSYFHLAAVMCNNFVNHLFTQAFDILEKKQLPTELLHVLMKETVDKAIAMQPSQAQTGPAFRGDSKSIEKHLQLLQGEPYMQKIYQDLTDSIIAFYKKK